LPRAAYLFWGEEDVRAPLVLIALVSLSGCASSARINQFRAFADLGHKNQIALTGVVDQAIASNIDANSQEILDARDVLVPGKKWPAGQSGDSILDMNNEAVIATTRQYAMIKRHAALLDDYFQKLAALASYDSAPIAASTTTTVAAIQELSPKLQNLKVGDVALPKAAGDLAAVVVNGIKGRMLDRELRQHGDLINRELELQERVLAFISERIAADQELLAQQKVLNKLAVPFGDLSKPLPAEWVASRRDLLIAQANAAEPAAEAARLSRELRQAYLQLLEGKLTPEDISSMASDLFRLLTLVDVVTAKPAGGSQ
jgi:hypothetical protein